ncbi:hypothetical protein AALA83_12250 [Oscillospiraceae bacterium 44-5]|jgi:hypothetical protein|nr:hypothetical protein [Lawsonibacter sp.]
MKKIKLTAIEDEFDNYEDLGRQEGRSWNFEFDLTPYLITCAMACGMLFVTRFVRKHVFHEDLYKKFH